MQAPINSVEQAKAADQVLAGHSAEQTAMYLGAAVTAQVVVAVAAAAVHLAAVA